MAAPALPADVQRLREQLLQDQAPSSRARTNHFEPSSFVSRYGRPYSSRKIPINTLLEMRTDAILRFAQLVALVSIFTAKWHIDCANPAKASFIDHALRRIIGRLIVQFYESWNIGWQALVKEFGLISPGWQYVDKDADGGPRVVPVWDGGPEVPALVWEPFVPLRPAAVAPVWAADGSFNGIAIAKNGISGAYGVPVVPLVPGDIIDLPVDISARFNDQDETRNKVDVAHSLWIVNERDSQYGSVWGYPRLGYAFKYWWSAEVVLGILNRSVERKGDPTVVVSYPPGSSRVGDREVPNQDIAMQIGEAGRSGSILTVPSDVWGDDMATSNTAPKWSITYLKAEEKFEELIKVLDYLDTMKFRSMSVSELAVAEGSGGSSSRNVAATTGERTAETQVFTMTEWDEVINRYMIPQLADANFPELRDVPARKVTQAFGENESALAADIVRSFANADPTKLPLDLPKLLERFQIDSLEGEALADWEKNLVKQAEQSMPPPTPAQPNGAAGVTDTGFYYAAPEHIALDGDEAMLAALPKTKHYSDRAVLAQTRLVRKLWFDQLTAQYEDFAKHVEQADLSLAEVPDKIQKLADRVVKAWRFTSATYAKAIKSTAVALGKILARAGGLELASSRIEPKGWDPASKALDEWVRENAAALVRSVEDTTRKQLSAFLASELQAGNDAETIAANLRAHFAEFPGWRADLIARTETARYYNAGTLFAAESVKAKQVQALDAQKGPTDDDCERRHGRIFSVADAWREAESEHIRGTLSFKIIPAGVQLSFKKQTRDEMGEVAARFDQQESTIYLAEDIDPATEGRYLERAVEWLIGS